MRISGYTPASTVNGRGTKKRAGSGEASFDIAGSDRTRTHGGATASGTIAGVDALLALQSVDDPLTGRRRAAAHGHDLLDDMDALKADLLAGRVPVERLSLIMGRLQKRAASDDPELERVIDEIELRARVELAKLGRFAS